METSVQYFLEKLKSLPSCRNDDFYRFADYIELKCLVNVDGLYSKKDFVDDARQRVEDLGEGGEVGRSDKQTSNAEKNDKWEKVGDDCFRVLESRVHLFKDHYPFELTDNGKAITLKSTLTKEKTYIFLLLCSDLKYTIKFKSELTGSFEIISTNVISQMMPNAIVQHFGSSNSEASPVPWKSSKLWDKLNWLADFLNEKIRVSEFDISKYDKGDRGIDIVAKLPVPDASSNLTFFFAQCACSPEDWKVKQDSMKFDSWYNLLSLSTNPNYFMFIPQCFRDSTGDWHDSTSIHRTILFDRLRILKALDNENFLSEQSISVVDKITFTKEAIY